MKSNAGTVGQRRAANAMERVHKLNARSDDFRKLYRAYLDRLGPAILMNGLGQALAMTCAAAGSTLTSDRERAHHELYLSVQQWLCRADGGVYPGSSDLLRAVMENGESKYLHAQAEALAWLEWHKKLCRASFPKAEENGE